MAKDTKITRYAGLLGIRKKSTVYIGPNDSNGLWTILREPADNGVDLALREQNKLVHIVMDPNKKGYWVLDEGPGFPVTNEVYLDEKGKKEKLNQFYVATGLTHAGSNFDSDQISRGTHGIGVKATNAMSKVFNVWTCNKGKWYAIEYKDAKLHKDVHKSKAPKLPHKLKASKGSIVYFEPDMSLFVKGSKLESNDILEWCNLTSYLIPKLVVKLTTTKGKTKTFKTKGIGEYIEKRLEETNATQNGKTFVHHGPTVDVAIAFANAETNSMVAYTNGLLNVDGGNHVKAVMDALVKSLKPYRNKKDDYKPTDLQDGLVGLINAKIAAPKFSNQRKDGLLDDRIYEPTHQSTLKALEEFWKKNKSLAKDIIKRASELRKKTADFLKDKKLIKNVNDQKKKLSAKLADVSSKTPREQTELFLVEGDSAAGPAKRARDKLYQAVYPLKGKPLNVMEVAKDKVNSNEELTSLLAAIGIDGKQQISRYGKILIMADADVDGAHISVLLLTFLYKYTPSLIKDGKVFIVKSPIFLSRHKGKTYFGFTKDEIYTQTGSTKADITYLKGLGECSDADLRYFAMDPGTRTVFKVEWPGSGKELKDFEALMGLKSDYRKKLLNVE